MSENETKKIYKTKEEYEADTNYSSRKIHREKFKDVETKTEMTPEQEKKATWKYLFICNPDRYALKSVLEELNNIRKHQYDIVFILGDCSRIIMREISIIFETALILQIPDEYFWKKEAKDFYVTNFMGKRQRHGSKHIVGVGNIRIDEIPEGEILVTTRNAIEDKQILHYIREKQPKLVFYLTDQPSNRKKLGNSILVGCHGLLPYQFNAVDVLGVTLEELDELD